MVSSRYPSPDSCWRGILEVSLHEPCIRASCVSTFKSMAPSSGLVQCTSCFGCRFVSAVPPSYAGVCSFSLAYLFLEKSNQKGDRKNTIPKISGSSTALIWSTKMCSTTRRIFSSWSLYFVFLSFFPLLLLSLTAD